MTGITGIDKFTFGMAIEINAIIYQLEKDWNDWLSKLKALFNYKFITFETLY